MVQILHNFERATLGSLRHSPRRFQLFMLNKARQTCYLYTPLLEN